MAEEKTLDFLSLSIECHPNSQCIHNGRDTQLAIARMIKLNTICNNWIFLDKKLTKFFTEKKVRLGEAVPHSLQSSLDMQCVEITFLHVL